LLVFGSCKLWRLYSFMDWFWKDIRS
jgi:hypothetical protein